MKFNMNQNCRKSYFLSVLLLIVCLPSCNIFKSGKTKNEKIQTQVAPKVDTVYVEKIIEKEKPEKKEFVPTWAPKKYQFNPSYTRYNDLIHTKLQVSFDWEKQWLYGKANLTLKPYFYPTDSLTLDAKGFQINRVAIVQKNQLKDLKYTYDREKIHIQLDRTYNRNENYEIFIDYIAKPNELNTEGSEAITDAKGLYFINPLGKEPNKPKQIWTQGETESSSCWFPTIDSPNERCTQEILITVDKKYTTLSNGLLISSKDNGNGTRTDHWKMSLPHAPYLFMMAIGEFTVVKDKWRNIEVNYYVEPEYAKYAKLIFGNTPEMLEFFSKKLGFDYPWEKYSQVVVRDFVSGAMENTTATIHYSALNHDDRAHLDNPHEDIIAHELFHHWFGDLVTCESWANLPLNESFATYGEYLWAEYKYGKWAADEGLENDLSTYLAEATQKREPLIRYYYKAREDMFDAHSYQKGCRVLHLLRNTIGDEAFFEGLKLYLHKNKFTDVEIAELRMAFEDVTGQDLMWFFNQYFMEPGHAELTIDYSYDKDTKKIKVQVQQKQNPKYTPIYKIPTKIQVTYPNQKVNFPVTITTADTTFEFTLTQDPLNVDFDPDKVLITKAKISKDKNFWLYQLTHADNYKQVVEADNSLKIYIDEDDVKEAYLKLLDHSYDGVRIIAIETLGSSDKVNQPKIIEKLMYLAQKDPKSRVRSAAVELLGTIATLEIPQDTKDKCKNLFVQSLNDSSYAVIASALSSLQNLDPNLALQQIDKLKNIPSLKVQTSVADILIDQNKPEAFDFIVNNFSKMEDGFEKFGLLQKFASYLSEQKDDIQTKGIDFLKNIAENHGTWWIRFASIRSLAIFKDKPGMKEFFKTLYEKEKNSQVKKMLESI